MKMNAKQLHLKNKDIPTETILKDIVDTLAEINDYRSKKNQYAGKLEDGYDKLIQERSEFVRMLKSILDYRNKIAVDEVIQQAKAVL